MKLAFLRALVVLCALTVSFAAGAASVETKVRLLVRDRPSSSSRIIDRVAAGKKLPVLGRSPDGSWIHVRSGAHDGWIPADSVKGGREEDSGGGDSGGGSDEEEARPLAKKRGVRPEAWVSKSRYHDGEETKLIVSVNKAELYGRPSSSGAVLGILRRGEAVQMVTRSPDKKWINVDIGGGSTAWIEAKAVKPGKVSTETPPPDESAQEESAPPPTITPEGAKRKTKVAKAEPPPEPEPEEAAPPPTPPPVKKKKSKTPPPEAEPETAPAQPAGKASEDEAPPGLAAGKPASSDETPPPEENKKKKHSRKLAKMAKHKDEEPAAAPEPEDESIVRDQWTSRGRIYVEPFVRAGIGIIEQRFTSNGMGPLSNYQASTDAFGAQIGLGLFGTVGKYLLLGADGSYTFIGAASLKYILPTDGSTVLLGVQSHTLDLAASAGLHFGVLGGLSVRVRLGGQMILNLVQPDVRTKLPSDRILGMTIGLAIAAPAVVHIARRPLGLSLFGGGLVPAARAQTVGLEDGAQSTTFGAFFGGGLTFGLMAPNLEHYRGQLVLEASYQYEFVATHYTGLSRRNDTITIADRGSAQHLIGAGLMLFY